MTVYEQGAALRFDYQAFGLSTSLGLGHDVS